MKSIITPFIIIGLGISSFLLKAQTIPNANFENWTSNEKPLSWDASNIHTTYGIIPINVQTVSKDSLATQNGTYNAKIQSKLIMSGFPVSPGFITLGTFWFTISPQAGGWKGGVICTQTPDTLKGYFKAAPKTGDKGVVIIELWKNAYDSANVVGRGYMEFPATTNSWNAFAVPINYTSGIIPDSMNIVIGSSDLLHQANIKDSSTFYVDNLSLVNVLNNANLIDLKQGSTTVTSFNPATLSYNVVLPVGTTTVPPLTYTLQDLHAHAVVTNTTSLSGSSTVLVTAEDNTTTKTYTVNFTIQSGIQNVSSSNFSLYPNPAKNQVTINIQLDNTEIVFVDLMGKEVNKQQLSKGNNIIGLKNMIDGLYFYKILSDKQTLFSGKIVVR